MEACPDVEAIGLGVPSTIDRKRGVAVASVNLPIADVPVRDLIAERIGLPTFMDNDANLAALAEHRFGVGRGTRNPRPGSRSAPASVAASCLEGEPSSGLERRRRGARSRRDRRERPPAARATAPTTAASRRSPPGPRSGARARWRPRRHPDSALGRALGGGRRGPPAGPSPRRRWRATGSRLRPSPASAAILAGPGELRQHLRPRRDRRRRRRPGRGGRAAAEPARRELRARALPPMNETKVARRPSARRRA